jgi:hypothetical protein
MLKQYNLTIKSRLESYSIMRLFVSFLLSVIFVSCSNQIENDFTDLKLYPDPIVSGNSEMLSITSAGTALANGEVQLKVFDLRGILVFEKTWATDDNKTAFWNPVDLRGEPLGAGLYTIEVIFFPETGIVKSALKDLRIK